jgi:oligoendopeptidase F
MKFSEMPYERPALDETLQALSWLAQQIADADSAQAQLDLFDSFEALSRHLSTQHALAEIRHTVDTRDAFYEAETAFWDENGPLLADRELDVYRALLASPYRSELEQALGTLVFEKMNVDVKSQAPEILDLMARENALTTE